MNVINEKLNKIQNDLDLINQKLNEIHADTHKMDNHIDFVNHIYGKIKRPFHFIFDKASRSMLFNESRESRARLITNLNEN